MDRKRVKSGTPRIYNRLTGLMALMHLLVLFILAVSIIIPNQSFAITITVMNTNDSGNGSLRQALADAASGDVIDFNISLPNTITLTSGELIINENLTIQGPGADMLTISGDNQFRVLRIQEFNVVGISGLTISDGNAVEVDGGGIMVEGNATLTINNFNINGNSSSFGNGGGINNDSGTVTITNSTISGNTAVEGGGIENLAGTVNITNSTISDNMATDSDGGGIGNFVSGTINMNNVTITNNNALEGGSGLFTSNEPGSAVNISNTIIAQNTGDDCNGTFDSLGFNLIGNNSGCVGFVNGVNGDQVGTSNNPINAMLGPLALNPPGTTATHALCIAVGVPDASCMGASPAIDAGAPGTLDGIPPRCETTDQRGVTRPQGTACDIGAFELEFFDVSITKSSLTTQVTAGTPTPITYTIILENIGDSQTTGVTVVDPLPSGAKFVNASSSKGSCTELNGTVTCNVGALDPDEKVTLTITINITPGLGSISVDNTATLTFQQSGVPENSTFTIPVGIGPINPDITGTYTGVLTFTRTEPAPFPQDDMPPDDPTTLTLVVDSSGNSFSGTFNAIWLPNVAIAGTGSGNIIKFDEPPVGGHCPGVDRFTGTLELMNNNEIFVDGDGGDCKTPYTFTGTLTRIGAGGGSTGSTGCAIAQIDASTPASMLPYLLIPLFILIRRGWKRFDKESLTLLYRQIKLAQRWLGNRGNLLSLVLLPCIIWFLSFFIVSLVHAQTLIKDCPNSPSAAVLDALCSELKEIADMQGKLTPEQQDLLNICTQLIEDPQPDCEAIDQTEPELIAELYTDILRLQSNNLLKKLHIRLSAVRAGTASSVTLQGLALNANDIRFKDTRVADISPIIPFTVTNQVSADEPSPFGKLGIFVNGSYNFGDRDQSTTQNGFDFNIFDVTGGVDYRFTNNFVLGVAFTYVRTDIDLDLSGGSLDTNGYNGSIYGSLYIFDNFYIDGLASFGWIDYNSERNINFTVDGTTVNQTANGDTDGFYYAFSANAGYDFHFEGLTFGPLGRFNYSQANIDGFQETIEGGGPGIGLALDVDDQEAKSLTTALGGQASYAISTGWGVFLPQVIFEWVHEFEDPDNTSASFVAGSGLGINPTINVQGEDPDRDTFNLGGGISAVFPHGVSAFVYYESILGWEDVTSYYISGGIRFEL